MKTLIVEDDFTCRLLLQGFLAGFGECHIAVNGNEAVTAFATAASRGEPYDLICMDIVMPEMNGQDALKKIRALEEERGILSSHGTKIIMTTSVNALEDMVGSFLALCDAYLTKPVDIAELLEQLKSLQLVA
jgi:two-component system, chemotaxis family, chemotaxis protein CheY